MWNLFIRSALDGIIGAGLWSKNSCFLWRGAQATTNDQEVTEAGESIAIFLIGLYKFIQNCINLNPILKNQKLNINNFVALFFVFSSWCASTRNRCFVEAVCSGRLEGRQILGASKEEQYGRKEVAGCTTNERKSDRTQSWLSWKRGKSQFFPRHWFFLKKNLWFRKNNKIFFIFSMPE